MKWQEFLDEINYEEYAIETVQQDAVFYNLLKIKHQKYV